MMLLTGDAKTGGTAVLVILEEDDLHNIIQHEEIVRVPMDTVGVEGVTIDIMMGDKEGIEEVVKERGIAVHEIDLEEK